MNFKLKKNLAAILTGGILIFGANATAEEIPSAQKIFEEAYLDTLLNERPFNQSIMLFGTNFHVDINAQGVLRDVIKDLILYKELKMSGDMAFEYINPETNRAASNKMPFYIEQRDDNLILYVQRGSKWQKFSLPNFDLIDLQKNIKSVEIIGETNTQRIFNVKLSGEKIAESLRAYDDEQDTTALSMAEVLTQKKFLHNLAAAFNSTDLICTWTFDRQTNETVSAAIDLTPLVKAYAKNILDEAAAGTADVTNEDKLLMESIGRYSEFHFLLNYAGVDAKKNMTPPAAARKVDLDSDIFEDFLKIMATAN